MAVCPSYCNPLCLRRALFVRRRHRPAEGTRVVDDLPMGKADHLRASGRINIRQFFSTVAAREFT